MPGARGNEGHRFRSLLRSIAVTALVVVVNGEEGDGETQSSSRPSARPCTHRGSPVPGGRIPDGMLTRALPLALLTLTIVLVLFTVVLLALILVFLVCFRSVSVCSLQAPPFYLLVCLLQFIIVSHTAWYGSPVSGPSGM